MRSIIRRIFFIVVVLAIVALAVWALQPRPIEVDLASATVGAMQWTVDEEGKTRIRDRYIISSPLEGRLRRVILEPGDHVAADETVVVIEPTDAQFLDPRARAEAVARVRAAEAAVRQAGAQRERARAALEFADLDRERLEKAYASTAATAIERDGARLLSQTRHEEHRAAQFAEEIATFELELARSALPLLRIDVDPADRDQRLGIQAPIAGDVLRVLQESAAVVLPGTPLLEIGDRTDLEVVIDVLSTDAVKVLPGHAVIIEHWGGGPPLEATVRLVEPAAFTKVSALGIEEQRVNVIADFISSPEERRTLGDGFRVDARIVVWESPDALQIPTSAAFRTGEAWTVFVVDGGVARVRTIEIGRRTGLKIQVLSGLEAQERVIVHPGDLIRDGAEVQGRERS